MQLNLKHLLRAILSIIIITSSFSCSISFEKRKYRPGYHVNVVKNYPHVKTHRSKEEPVVVNNNFHKYALFGPNITPHCVPQIVSKPIKQNHQPKSYPPQFRKPLKIRKIRGARKNDFIEKMLITKKEKATVAWKIGAVAIFLASVAIFLSILLIANITGATYTLLYTIIPILCVAFIIMVVALCIGFTKTKEPDEIFKPGFVNRTFIFSLFTMSLALVGFILSLVVWPFYLIGWIIGLASAVCSIICFSLGFNSLKKEKSLKIKLIVIFGLIALMLAIIAGILILI